MSEQEQGHSLAERRPRQRREASRRASEVAGPHARASSTNRQRALRDDGRGRQAAVAARAARPRRAIRPGAGVDDFDGDAYLFASHGRAARRRGARRARRRCARGGCSSCRRRRIRPATSASRSSRRDRPVATFRSCCPAMARSRRSCGASPPPCMPRWRGGGPGRVRRPAAARRVARGRGLGAGAGARGRPARGRGRGRRGEPVRGRTRRGAGVGDDAADRRGSRSRGTSASASSSGTARSSSARTSPCCRRATARAADVRVRGGRVRGDQRHGRRLRPDGHELGHDREAIDRAYASCGTSRRC